MKRRIGPRNRIGSVVNRLQERVGPVGQPHADSHHPAPDHIQQDQEGDGIQRETDEFRQT